MKPNDNSHKHFAPNDDSLDSMFDGVHIPSDTEIEQAAVRFESRLKTLSPRRINRSRRVYGYRMAAACAIIFGVLGTTAYYLLRENTPKSVTRYDERVTLTLHDGSQRILSDTAQHEVIVGDDEISIIRQDNGLVYTHKQTPTKEIKPQYNTLNVPKGKTFDLVLQDGTHVWLNADSEISFPVTFTGKERRVKLQGEAYFVVTPNAHCPFIVETRQQNLRVLGTEFNIQAYGQEHVVRTTLVKGSVRLTALQSAHEIVLTPGQQASLNEAAAQFSVTEVNPENVTAWMQGLFAFDGLSLEEVFAKLARWYNIEYHFDQESIKSIVIRGNLKRYEDIYSLFDILETLADLEINGDQTKFYIKNKENS